MKLKMSRLPISFSVSVENMEEYELCEKIGDGAQGAVYLARHIPTSKKYAIKIMKCVDQVQVDFALKEIRVLIQLRHRSIVSYTDFFLRFDSVKTTVASSKDLRVCLVMELCENGDISGKVKEAKRQFMERGAHPIPEEAIVSWICQCAEALQYIHEKGFLHRDMKPTNVFFTANNEVKLGDFGLAAAAGCAGRNSAVGTPYYFAPELLLRQPYNFKVDVWGLGVIVLELLTLRERPINSQVLQDPLCVDEVVGDITDMGFSVKLATLVRDMLQRMPDARPSPAVVVQRLTVVPAPRLSIDDMLRRIVVKPTALQHVSSSATSVEVIERESDCAEDVCAVCEVDLPTVFCQECKQKFCDNCDVARHKNHRRNDHVRVPHRSTLELPSSVSTPVSSTPLHPQAARFSGSMRSSMNGGVPKSGLATSALKEVTNQGNKAHDSVRAPKPPSTGRTSTVASSAVADVPQAPVDATALHVPCPKFQTIQDAVDFAASVNSSSSTSSQVKKIFVRGGFLTESSLVLNCENVEIIGLDPKPMIVVSDAVAAVTINSTGGTLANFEIRQTRSERRSGEPRPVGIDVRCGQWRIKNCDVTSVIGSCIYVLANADPIVSDCLLQKAGQAGVYIADDGRGTFQRNTVAECAYAGVLLKHGASAIFTDNIIRGGLETGLFCHDSNGLFERNVITENVGCGIVVKGNSAPTIRKNCISENKQAGIFCCDGSRPTVLENEIRGNGKAGVLIKSESNPKITGNTIKSSRETGIYVFENGAGTIEDNEICSNCNAGILVTTGGHPVVRHNLIQHNMYEGVWVCKKGRGNFSDNDLRFNRKGPKDVETISAVQWVANIEA